IGPEATANLKSVLVALERFGSRFGLDQLHRPVQLFAQLMHESCEFRYDRELWGPTPAQRRYDVRTDLGNTAARDGDGFKYRGRTSIEVTGKANVRTFRNWCRSFMPAVGMPDFVSEPDEMNTDPWEGLAPIWFWTKLNLNRWADQGDV